MTMSVLRTAQWLVGPERLRRCGQGEHFGDQHQGVVGRPDSPAGRPDRYFDRPGRFAGGFVAGDQAVPGDCSNDQFRIPRPAMPAWIPPPFPLTFFASRRRRSAGRSTPIVKPAHVRLLDYEVEIGLVIGRDIPVGSTVSETNLADCIAGLVVTNDVSARDVQLPQTQFYEAKSYPTFTPYRPDPVAAGFRRTPAVRRSAADAAGQR